MERIRIVKNKIWRRNNIQPESPSQTSSGERSNPESSYLSLVSEACVPSLSMDTSSPVQQMDTENDIEDPLANQLQLITETNNLLQETIRDLTEQLNSVTESQLSLISKNDDLTQKLQLERRRFYWQKNFYEKKILDLSLGTSASTSTCVINGNDVPVDPKQFLDSLSNSFYQEAILDLVAEQEKKDGEIKDIKSAFEEEIRRLKESHEADVSEIVESNLLQVMKLTDTHEQLIKDLLHGCEEGIFKEMKDEFLIVAEQNTELKVVSGRKIWDQFQRLSSDRKGILVAAVCIVTVATAGWASWGFVTWVWPRLIIFVESIVANPEVLGVWARFLMECLNSQQFQTFVVAWEQGQPLAACIKPFLNTALLASALQMAPNLFAQFKKRSAASVKPQ